MEALVLTDKSVKPTDDLIFSIIGKNSIYWKELMARISKAFPDAKGEWNYYNDGKSWLFKMVNKKKTLFWIGIHGDTFRTTFYFGDKAETEIKESSIPEQLKEQYLSGKRYGKIRAISIKVNEPLHVESLVRLAEIKSKF